jgi:hypothetical protein
MAFFRKVKIRSKRSDAPSSYAGDRPPGRVNRGPAGSRAIRILASPPSRRDNFLPCPEPMHFGTGTQLLCSLRLLLL